MFQDTRPAEFDGPDGQHGASAFGEFRVDSPRERSALLRQLRDGSVPVNLNAPDGAVVGTQLWALDDTTGRMTFSADEADPRLQRVVDADECVAVAYLEAVKLQFDVSGLLLVRGPRAVTLQAALPRAIYRFQRRDAYRVRVPERKGPLARLRHPALPDMQLALRVLDVSIGGCALWQDADVPALQPGTRIHGVQFSLDDDTRFEAAVALQHVSAQGTSSERGVRLGCRFEPLGGSAERVLQRWIDQTQKRHRMLSVSVSVPVPVAAPPAASAAR